MDEWVELDAPAKGVDASEPVTIATTTLRHGAERISLSICNDIAAVIGWPRYRVAWNRDRKQFRIKGAADGQFEGFHPPRGPKAGSGSAAPRVIIRVPLPSDLVHVAGGGGAPCRRPSSRWRGEDVDRHRPVPVLAQAAVRVR